MAYPADVIGRCVSALMTLLQQLVDVSQRVGATPARLTKVRELAAGLRALEPRRDRHWCSVLVRGHPARTVRHRLRCTAYSLRRRGRARSDIVDCRGRPSPGRDRGDARLGFSHPPFHGSARAVLARDACGTGVPHSPAARRAAPGCAGRCHDRCHRRGIRRADRARAAGGNVFEEHRCRCTGGAARRRQRTRTVPARDSISGRADARSNRRQYRGSVATAHGRGGVRMEDGRCAHPGAQGR